jgi:hypothetical protein
MIFGTSLFVMDSFFFKVKRQYIKLASRLIKNLPVPLGTLVRKRVRLKLAAPSLNSYIVYDTVQKKARGFIDPIIRLIIQKTKLC